MGIKSALLSILGEKRYLKTVATSFQRLYQAGLVGQNYQDVYFLRQIIHPGMYCGDIGAHLGYYTIELGRLTGASGKVIAVEPMPAFNSVLGGLIARKRAANVDLKQVAVGGGSEYVEMGIPKVGAMKRFAYARVKQSSEHLEYIESVKVRNLTGDELFAGLPRLDFIKCDVEGLEVQVFNSMSTVLHAHHPMLLCELADKAERIKLYELLKPIGYTCYRLIDKKLHVLDVYSDDLAVSHNHYFIPDGRKEALRAVLA